MPTYYDEDGNEVDLSTIPLDPNIRRQLRQAEKADKEVESVAQERDALAAKLASYERRDSIASAGVPSTGLGLLFAKAYDGPMDTESIRKAAEEYGIIQPANTSNEDAQLQAELELQRKAQGATVGSVIQTDPAAELKERFAKAASLDEIKELLREAGQKGIPLQLGTAL